MLATTVSSQEIVRPPVRPIIVGAGLCRTCVKAAECTFPRDPIRPVRSCDEFEGGQDPRSERVSGIVAPSIFSLGGAPEKGTGELKGLCVQCARRQTCTYPKPAGGVWHCDELA
jgi:hypothetical protein